MDDVAAASGVTKLIVYRHFDSKEALYRAVLDGVAARLADEFAAGLELPRSQRRGFIARTLLTVARDNPDGFRLLFRHSVREPRFADVLDGYRLGALAVAHDLIGERIPDPTLRAWAAQVMADYVEEAVLAWLDVGDPARDGELVERATDGLLAMFAAWAVPRTRPR